jgi:type IV secretion system protein VirD4
MESLIGFIIFLAILAWLFKYLLEQLGFSSSRMPSSGGKPWYLFLLPPMWGRGVLGVLGALFFPEKLGLGRKNAELMSRSEASKLLSAKNTGFVVDGDQRRLSEDMSCRNMCVVATTGGGKTAGFIIPNIMQQSTGSMVITDPSGAIFEKTAGDLARRGYKVKIISPQQLERSIRYNPLAQAVTVPEINEVAHILVKTANPNSKDPFWTDSAEALLAFLIRTLKRTGDEAFMNLANLYHLLNHFGDGRGLNTFMAKYADDTAFAEYKAFVSQSTNTMQSILSTAKTSLKFMADPELAELTATSSFSFESLRQEKTALFLIFPQARLSYYSFFLNLFYTQLFQYCLDDGAYRRGALPVYFLLDEFGHLAIPGFGSIITTTRQRRIAIAIILQSLSQLESRYGKQEAHTIINGGIASKIFYSGLDHETTRMLEAMLGTARREVRDSENRLHIKDDPILTAAEIRTMKDTEVIGFFANKRPAKFEIVRYFENPRMRGRVDKATPDLGRQGMTGVRLVSLD